LINFTRLLFPSPIGFSPLYESLLPSQILAMDPCFHFGNLTKSNRPGPLEVTKDTAFVPQPVGTATVNSFRPEVVRLDQAPGSGFLTSVRSHRLILVKPHTEVVDFIDK
jgi:hypothetical protein